MTNEEIEGELKHLVTKADLEGLRGETRASTEQLRAEMHKEIASLIKWMIGLQIPTWLGLLGILLKK